MNDKKDNTDYWWCSHCQTRVDPQDVTFDELHDIRSGGCGDLVIWGIDVAKSYEQLKAKCNELFEEKERWRKALESLTPQGSEFYNDIGYCLNWIHKRDSDKHKHMIELVRRECELQSRLDRIIKYLNKRIDYKTSIHVGLVGIAEVREWRDTFLAIAKGEK